MNRKQREKNRATAKAYRVLPKCPNCGMREPHWVSIPTTLEYLVLGPDPEGFWTCPKLYGPDGRRLE